MKKIIFLFALAILASCNEASVISVKDKNFPENRWDVNDIKSFEFEVKEDIEPARIIIEFSHIYEPMYATVPIQVRILYHNGQAETIRTKLELKDDSGKYISDCLGDICDLSQTIKSNVRLEKGSYKVMVKNAYPSKYIPNVLGLGIRVEKDSR